MPSLALYAEIPDNLVPTETKNEPLQPLSAPQHWSQSTTKQGGPIKRTTNKQIRVQGAPPLRGETPNGLKIIKILELLNL